MHAKCCSGSEQASRHLTSPVLARRNGYKDSSAAQVRSRRHTLTAVQTSPFVHFYITQSLCSSPCWLPHFCAPLPLLLHCHKTTLVLHRPQPPTTTAFSVLDSLAAPPVLPRTAKAPALAAHPPAVSSLAVQAVLLPDQEAPAPPAPPPRRVASRRLMDQTLSSIKNCRRLLSICRSSKE